MILGFLVTDYLWRRASVLIKCRSGEYHEKIVSISMFEKVEIPNQNDEKVQKKMYKVEKGSCV